MPEDDGVEVGNLPIAVPQAGYQGGEDAEIGEILRVGLIGALDDFHSPAAGGGEGGDEGLHLAVGNGLAGSAHRGEGLQIPVDAGFSLGVHHRVGKGQQIQQQPAPLRRWGGEERLQASVQLGKDRAGRGQGFQGLRRPLEAEILPQEAGPGNGGLLQALLEGVKRL